MLDLVFKQRDYSLKLQITIKMAIAVATVILATFLPQIVHVFAGSQGGIVFLPMYLPVLIGGCLLGYKYGIMVGLLSPIASFVMTSLVGNPMPLLQRLPFMVFELGIFGLVSGLFSNRISKNPFMAFPAILTSQLIGRLAFVASVGLFQEVSGLNPSAVWSQVLTGVNGLYLQAIIVPIIIIALSKLMKKDTAE